MSVISAIEFLKKGCSKYAPNLISTYDSPEFNVEELEDLKCLLEDLKYCTTDQDDCYHLCASCRNNIKIVSNIKRNWNWEEMRPDNDFNEINRRIIKNLRSECEHYRDTWASSSYTDVDYDLEDDDFFDESEIPWNRFIEHNYCANNSHGVRLFCCACKRNYKKIGYHLNNLQELSLNWNIPFDENIQINTIRDVQSLETFKLKHPNVVLDPNWKIKKYWSEPERDLEDLIEELQDYDIIIFTDFTKQSVEPLKKLTNLKGIVFGIWNDADLNLLESLNLQFICVKHFYNRHLCDKIYDITCIGVNNLKF